MSGQTGFENMSDQELQQLLASGQFQPVNPETGKNYPEAQSSTLRQLGQVGGLDPRAEPGSARFPRVQTDPQQFPDQGQFFLDQQGRVQQVPRSDADQFLGGVNDRVRALARGVPVLGAFADEANAATAATLAPFAEPALRNLPPIVARAMGYDPQAEISDAGDWGQRFEAAKNIQTFGDQRFDQENPVESGALQLTGGLSGTVAALPALAPLSRAALGAEAGLLMRSGAAGVEGAAAGGLHGYGAGQGGFTDPSRLKGAGGGALIGGGLGFAAPVTAHVGGQAWRATGGRVVDALRGNRNVQGPVSAEADRLAKVLRGDVDQGVSRASEPPNEALLRALDKDASTRAYHGTASDFADFDPSRGRVNPMTGPAPHFTSSPEEASGYALRAGEGANVRPVRLRAENPLDVGWSQDTPRLGPKYAEILGEPPKNADVGQNLLDDLVAQERALESPGGEALTEEQSRAVWNRVYERLQKAGYDGLRARGTPGDHGGTPYDKYVVWDPTKISSEFDPAALQAAAKAPGSASPQAPSRDNLEAALAVSQQPQVGARASEVDDAYIRIARALERGRVSPDEAVSRTEALGPFGVLADVSPSTQDLLRAVINRPGKGAGIAKENLSARQQGLFNKETGEYDIRPSSLRITDKAAEGLGLGDKQYGAEIDALMKARKEAADPLYAQMRTHPPVPTEVLADFAASPEFLKAYQGARAISQKEFVRVPGVEGEVIQPLPPEPPSQLDWRTLDLMKQAMDDTISTGPLQGMGATSRGASKGYRQRFVERLDSLNPDYKAARDAFAGPTALKEAMEEGRKLLREDAYEVGKKLADLTEGEQQMLRLGALQELKNKLGNANVTFDAANQAGLLKPNQLARFRELFPSRETFGDFITTLENERTMYGTSQAAFGNSTTAKQLLNVMEESDPQLEGAGQAITGVAQGNPLALIQAIRRMGMESPISEPVAETIASVLTNADRSRFPEALRKMEQAKKAAQAQDLVRALQGTGAGQVGAATSQRGN